MPRQTLQKRGQTKPRTVTKSYAEAPGFSHSISDFWLRGPELEVGLLGQNFLKHYGVLIKQDVVEFHVC